MLSIEQARWLGRFEFASEYCHWFCVKELGRRAYDSCVIWSFLGGLQYTAFAGAYRSVVYPEFLNNHRASYLAVPGLGNPCVSSGFLERNGMSLCNTDLLISVDWLAARALQSGEIFVCHRDIANFFSWRYAFVLRTRY